MTTWHEDDAKNEELGRELGLSQDAADELRRRLRRGNRGTTVGLGFKDRLHPGTHRELLDFAAAVEEAAGKEVQEDRDTHVLTTAGAGSRVTNVVSIRDHDEGRGHDSDAVGDGSQDDQAEAATNGPGAGVRGSVNVTLEDTALVAHGRHDSESRVVTIEFYSGAVEKFYGSLFDLLGRYGDDLRQRLQGALNDREAAYERIAVLEAQLAHLGEIKHNAKDNRRGVRAVALAVLLTLGVPAIDNAGDVLTQAIETHGVIEAARIAAEASCDAP